MSPPPAPPAPPPKLASSSNISPYLWFTGMAFAARSLWSQSVLSTYIYITVSESPTALGNLTGLMGLSQIIASIPAGIISDKYRRDTVLKISLLFASCSIGFITAAVFYSSYAFLLVGCACYGSFYGAFDPNP